MAESTQRRGGIISFNVDGEQYPAKGNFSYGLGKSERTAVVGCYGSDGYSEKPTAPFIEGEITDRTELNLDVISKIVNATITLALGNNKIIVLRNAWSCNKDGLSVETDEGNIKVRFEGLSAEEVR